jgi:hypothetical protein
MKSTAVWILRYLIIPIGFIWSTGIFYGIHYLNTTSEKTGDPCRTFTKEELSTLEITPKNVLAYGDSLFKERKTEIAKTGVYDPFVYFRDLKQFTMFEKVYHDSLEYSPQGRMLYMSSLSGIGSSSLSSLTNLRDNNWRDVDVYALAVQNYAQCNGYRIKIMGVDEARHYWFPLEAQRDAEYAKQKPTKFLPDILMPVLAWILRVYLRGLPIALVLFLIWRIKFRKEYQEASWGDTTAKPQSVMGFTPLSFLIALLIWPVIIWLDIKNRGNALLRKAEVLSRRKQLFSLVTKGEQRLVALGRSMDRKEFRSYLDSTGMVRRHSFTFALVVTVVLALTPQKSSAQEKTLPDTCTVTMHTIDHDVGAHSYTMSVIYEAIVPLRIEVLRKLLDDILHFTNGILKTLKGFLPGVDGIPKVSNQFFELKMIC